MKDVMIDIETMGNTNNAPIIQIGAAYFDFESKDISDPYLINVNLADAIANGAKPDGSTILWWLSQSKEARESLTAKDTPMFKEAFALADFNKYVKKAKRVWSHATFDFVILCESMKRCGIKPNMHYRSARDIRTLVWMTGDSKSVVESTPARGVAHNALSDVMFQIDYCRKAYKMIKGE